MANGIPTGTQRQLVRSSFLRWIIGAVLVVANESTPAAAAESGAELYRRYCAACHGLEGRGDGPVADSFRTLPPDLTRLQSDEAEIMQQIDGRRTIRAHGTAAMPVWGEVFEQSLIDAPNKRRTTLLTVQALADYVQRLRRPGSAPRPTPSRTP